MYDVVEITAERLVHFLEVLVEKFINSVRRKINPSVSQENFLEGYELIPLVDLLILLKHGLLLFNLLQVVQEMLQVGHQ